MKTPGFGNFSSPDTGRHLSEAEQREELGLDSLSFTTTNGASVTIYRGREYRITLSDGTMILGGKVVHITKSLIEVTVKGMALKFAPADCASVEIF